jgi:hypothetical protein
MSEISGSAVMTAISNAIDNGNSDYTLAVYYTGISVGQCFSRGWSKNELDVEIANIARSHPKLAERIRAELADIISPTATHSERP